MKKFVLSLVLCGFAALTVGCGDTATTKKTETKSETKTETKPKTP